MKLLVTGGHITPALACIDEFLKQNDINIVFVGRKYYNDREKTTSLEYTEVQKRNIPFYHLRTGRFTRVISLRNLSNLLFIPFGFLQAFQILRKEKPDIILSFGGYIGFPLAFVGWMLKIPVYTHEQTIHPGIANRIISIFARKVFTSFEESKRFFPSQKILCTGNPVRADVFKITDKPFSIDRIKPVIYVTGGSLGAHSINIRIKSILNRLLEKYTVIHQTGNIAEYNDFRLLTEFRNQLPEDLKRRYFIREHISSSEIGYVYSIADIVVSRCGANTFFELIALQKPSVLIPLPWSAYQEQQKQAELLQRAGVAEVFDQSQDSSVLLSLIQKVVQNRKSYDGNFQFVSSLYHADSAETIAKEISTSH